MLVYQLRADRLACRAREPFLARRRLVVLQITCLPRNGHYLSDVLIVRFKSLSIDFSYPACSCHSSKTNCFGFIATAPKTMLLPPLQIPGRARYDNHRGLDMTEPVRHVEYTVYLFRRNEGPFLD